MVTFLGILGMLTALVPFLIEVWRAHNDKHKKATNAIRTRDRDELRALLERRKRLRTLQGKDESIPPRGQDGL